MFQMLVLVLLAAGRRLPRPRPRRIRQSVRRSPARARCSRGCSACRRARAWRTTKTRHGISVSGTASGKPYTTRILVRQPEDPSRFSGIVVAEAMHASGNSWMFYFTRIYMMRRGHISVEIAPQKAGTEATIVANPQRYAAINIPEAGQANEIIAQVGALLKSNGPSSPLAGLRVRRMILMGTSQSAGTLRGYLTAHPTWRMPDGKPIFDGFLPTSTAGMPIPSGRAADPDRHADRSDGGAAKGSAYRRPDGDAAGDQFRLYRSRGCRTTIRARVRPTVRIRASCP